MSILDSIAAFCDSHNIRYTLSSGTLIGAVRHKGYIPWDDDIDLYMMREDYNRFLSEYEGHTGNYEILHDAKDKNYFYPFAKVVDSRTIVYEDETIGYEIGVWVDIFPIDYVPDTEKAKQRTFALNIFFNKLWRSKMATENPWRSRLAYVCYRYFPLTRNMVRRLRNSFVFNNKPSSLVSNLSCMNHRPFPASFMNEFTILPFEDREYKVIANYDEYLTITYGDYMQLPPEDQRVHHYFKAYWKD